MSPLPPGHQPTKGAYYGYTSPGALVVTGGGSGSPVVRADYLGFRTLLRGREPVRVRVVRLRVRP